LAHNLVRTPRSSSNPHWQGIRVTKLQSSSLFVQIQLHCLAARAVSMDSSAWVNFSPIEMCAGRISARFELRLQWAKLGKKRGRLRGVFAALITLVQIPQQTPPVADVSRTVAQSRFRSTMTTMRQISMTTNCNESTLPP
jgi:hypothetical protein